MELAKSHDISTVKSLAKNRKKNLEGTGSGFFLDKFGHIVTNYHLVAKLAADRSGLQHFEVCFENAKGESISREAKIVGFDPTYDLAVLKVDVEGHEVKPVYVGTSCGLRLGNPCFAVACGNAYGFGKKITPGVVGGLGREILAPNGAVLSGAIQHSAVIWAGNSGGPLVDYTGHVVGVNTETFIRKGWGTYPWSNLPVGMDRVVAGSGEPSCPAANFAIPIDEIVPNLMVFA